MNSKQLTDSALAESFRTYKTDPRTPWEIVKENIERRAWGLMEKPTPEMNEEERI